MTRQTRTLLTPALLLFLASTIPMTLSAQEESPPSWSEVDRLISEDKFEAASRLVREIRETARGRGDTSTWTRALVREVQLRTALHGYETSVRFLRAEPWPESPRARLVLELVYAQSLVTYNQAYSWEIRQRERVVSTDEIDLKAWTLDQIATQAHRAYLAAWEERERWGDGSLGDLAEYFEAGNYPAHVRGTLRDAVTYLWAELLANTSLWRPEHSNEIYRLDLDDLLAGPTGEVELADPDVHPILKSAAILADLEAWHAREMRPEAAFEARLERLRRLRGSFSQEDDREKIRRDLEERLEALGRSYPWWSAGMALLAEITREGEEPDALIEARRIALEGERSHPDSYGGRSCRHIVATIEQPGYEVAAMKSDGPGRRSLRLRHKNLEEVHFRAYALDLVASIEENDDGALWPRGRQVDEIVARRRPVAEWTAELPETPDYRWHATYITPPLERLGLYLVVASARRDFAENFNQRTAAPFLRSDLVFLQPSQTPHRSASAERPTAVRVVSGRSGRGLPRVEVALYLYDYRRGHRKVDEKTTDSEGKVRFLVSQNRGQRYFLLARRGEDIALQENFFLPYPHEPPVYDRALVYTDRSIYRPQQKVLYKVVAYRQQKSGEEFDVLTDTAVRIALVDANGQDVTSLEAETNRYGSTSGEFEIPAGRLLGAWQVIVSDPKSGEHLGQAMVRVEEYKRPTFEVEVEEPTSPLRLNQPAKLEGKVLYYFGLPVTSGEVSWRVTREPVWSFWYARYPYRPIRPGGMTAQTVAVGTASLDAEGRFEVTFTPEADERRADDEISYRYRLSVDVTDDGGETRSASRAFRLGFVAVDASVLDPPGFFRHGEPVELTVSRQSLDGAPQAGEGSWRIVELAQPEATLLPADQPLPPAKEGFYQTPGDRLRARWESLSYAPEGVLRDWQDGRELAKGELTHGDDGKARLEATLESGAYRLHYRTRDPYGATREITYEFLVAGTAAPLRLPGLLEVERGSAEVGEVARILVHSGLEDQEMELAVYRGGEVERRRLVSTTGARVIEIPIDRDDRGGFGVALTLVRDHQLISLGRRVDVPWSDRRLEIEFATFRDRLRPGQKETWSVRLKPPGARTDASGAPSPDAESLDAESLDAAELLAYMYDKSLDLFAPHNPVDPLDLYPRRGVLPGVATSLGQASQVWWSVRGFADLPARPHLERDRLKFLSGYGIGGPGRRMRQVSAMKTAPSSPRAQRLTAEVAVADEAAFVESIAESVILEEQTPGAPPPPPPSSPPPAAPVELRSDFSETAFWEPHLLLEKDGTVSFEFEVPDSLTEWNVWVHALTRDLRAGRENRQVRTSKELMVRPYLPRFLREGDRATLRVVVNNAGEDELRGRLDFEIRDPESGESLNADYGLSEAASDFVVEAGGGAELEFPIRVPPRVRTVAFEVKALAGTLSDGERRPLPVLPSRVHLAQSRFTTLNDKDRRTLHFEDLAADDDPTRIDQQLIVTLDAQLFYSVLHALPYLVNYPYECTEQTLNRFLSTGIVTSLYEDYPAVARMAERFSSRERRYETWDAEDPNRKMALEETPWLIASQGGREDGEELVNVLDPEIASAHRDTALAKLREAQTSSGGFPWWPGGPPSPYLTLYLLDGFSRALEFDVEVPRDVVTRAWSYLHRYYVDEMVRNMIGRECCWETVSYLNYVLSNYPDLSWTGGLFTEDDREKMLEFSFRHWRRHSPRLKSYLALTLHRAGRGEDAMNLFASVMDSAKTSDEEGTFWAPEDRAWLWYNDTIESHAFALRTMLELSGDDARRHGLVQWLFLNKHLNHWKSTRATAEVIYSLVHYLEREGALAVREEARVALGERTETFTFEPDRYTGKENRILVPGEEVTASLATIEVTKETPGFLFASATWHFSTEELPQEARGDFFSVERRYFRRVHTGREWTLEPMSADTELAVGDQLEVHLSIRTKHAAEYVHLRDPRGAGFEPETLRSGYRWDLGVGAYEEVRDSGTNFFFEWLPVGEYTFKYRLRANVAGTFRVGPATLQSMYAPEFVGYSSGTVLGVTP